jgi:hypothetical protein
VNNPYGMCDAGLGYPTLVANDYDNDPSNGNNTLEDVLFQGGMQGSSFCRNISRPNVDYASVHMYLDKWKVCRGAKKIKEVGVGWIKDHAAIAAYYGKPLFVGEFGLTATTGGTCSNCGPGTSGCWNQDERRCLYDVWMKRARDPDVGGDAIAPWGYKWDADSTERPETWRCCDEEDPSDCVGTPDGGQSCTPDGGLRDEPRYHDIVDAHGSCAAPPCACVFPSATIWPYTCPSGPPNLTCP